MTVTPIDGVKYWWNGVDAFTAPSRPSLPVGSVFQPGRDELVPGVDMPNKIENSIAVNVGPYDIGTWTEVYAGSPTSTIVISTPGDLVGRRFWGRVQVQAGMADWAVKLKQCWFCGPPPEAITSAAPELIRGYGDLPSKWEIHDSLLDPSPWLTSAAPGGARASLHPVYTGIRGGNIRMYHSEIRNVHDGWNWIGPNGQDGSGPGMAAVAAQEHLSYMNWYHKSVYGNNIVPPNDGQPHGDAIQTNFGRNFTCRGDYLGGNRDMTGYWTWPNNPGSPFVGQGYNSGDDFIGAGLQLSQERGTYNGTVQYVPAVHEISNFIVEDGWIEGCGAGINHAVMPYASAWAGSAIRRMKFVAPRGSNWGITYQLSSPVVNGAVVQTGTGSGYYIIRHSSFAGFYSNNIRTDTGGPVPITNG